MHGAPAGRDVSISELLADVRRIKLAGDSLRAVRSRPATAASQGRAAASSPSQELHTGPAAGQARQVDKQCSQDSPLSDGSCSGLSSDDCLGRHRSGGQSVHSNTDDSSISEDHLPGLTR